MKIYCKFNQDSNHISTAIGKMFNDFLKNKNICKKRENCTLDAKK